MASMFELSKNGLLEAILSNNKVQVQMLIQRGIDVNLTWAEDDSTPLHKVAQRGNIEIARILLDAGANIHTSDKDGISPFHIVAESGDIEFARLLLDAGADIHATNKNGSTPFFLAAVTDKIEMAHLLINAGADINVTNRFGETPLHTVAAWNSIEIVRVLIDAGANIHAINKDGKTPLHIAAIWGNIEIARILLDAGAKIHTTDKDGNTPFHDAVGSDEVELARILLDAGADINAINDIGERPLHRALKSHQIGISHLLFDAGVNINATITKGSTPFHIVAKNRDTELDPRNFASVFLRNTKGCNALFLKHVVRLKCLGSRVTTENMSFLRSNFDEELRMFEKECETEIASMKRQEIREDYRFSLCDVLTKGDDELRMVLQVGEVRLKLQEIIREMSYPVYGNMISMKFERIVKTVEYSMKARKIIGFIVNSVRSIPDECVDKIASYFTNKDLKDLAFSFK